MEYGNGYLEWHEFGSVCVWKDIPKHSDSESAAWEALYNLDFESKMKEKSLNQSKMPTLTKNKQMKTHQRPDLKQSHLQHRNHCHQCHPSSRASTSFKPHTLHSQPHKTTLPTKRNVTSFNSQINFPQIPAPWPNDPSHKTQPPGTSRAPQNGYHGSSLSDD